MTCQNALTLLPGPPTASAAGGGRHALTGRGFRGRFGFAPTAARPAAFSAEGDRNS